MDRLPLVDVFKRNRDFRRHGAGIGHGQSLMLVEQL